MTRQEIENKISPIFSDIMYIDLEEIDSRVRICCQQGMDELDVLELLEAIDEEFGTNLYKDRDIDLSKISIEDIVTLIESKQ